MKLLRSPATVRAPHVVLAALVCSAFAAVPQSPEDDKFADAAAIRALVERGDARRALLDLERSLEFVGLAEEYLELGAAAAHSAEQPDLVLGYLNELLSLPNLPPERRAALEGRLEEADAERATWNELAEARAVQLAGLVRAAEQAKMPSNAADLLRSCFGTSQDAAARESWRKLGSGKGRDALVNLDAPVADIGTSARTTKGQTELRGTTYTVRSKAEPEVVQQIATALDGLSEHYRRIYRYKEKGGTLPRLTVQLHVEDAEYRAAIRSSEPRSLAVLDESSGTLHALDPRADGGELDALWPDLAREASRPFASLVAKLPVPPWLSAGTSSYFEGVLVSQSGRVEVGGPSAAQLAALEAAFAAKAEAAEPEPEPGPKRPNRRERKAPLTLEDVLRLSPDKRIPRTHEPYHHGLVYFLLHGEDDTGAPRFGDRFHAYWKEFSSGAEQDPLVRFEKVFVDGAGFESLEAFEEALRVFVQNVRAEERAQASALERLEAAARRKLAAGQSREALRVARRSLSLRPERAAPHATVAECFEAEGDRDGAVLAWRRAAATALVEGDGAVLARADARLTELAPTFGPAWLAAERAHWEGLDAAATRLVGSERPRNAALVLRRAAGAHAGAAALRYRAENLLRAADVPTGRWHRVPMSEGRVEMQAKGNRWTPSPYSVMGSASGDFPFMNFAVPESVHPPFRLELHVRDAQLKESGSSVGLQIGSSWFGRNFQLQIDGRGGITGGQSQPAGDTVRFSFEPLGTCEPPDGRLVRIEMAVLDGKLEISIDGEAIESTEFDPSTIRGGIRFNLNDGRARFGPLRIWRSSAP
ncbi:MAG: hypothetical protein GC161_03765 [Planctomycetaceae bacterium]|nr:hypothetical protein [Planctomycetaceae bacterium]